MMPTLKPPSTLTIKGTDEEVSWSLPDGREGRWRLKSRGGFDSAGMPRLYLCVHLSKLLSDVRITRIWFQHRRKNLLKAERAVVAWLAEFAKHNGLELLTHEPDQQGGRSSESASGIHVNVTGETVAKESPRAAMPGAT